MAVSREEKFQEAINRLQKLGIIDDAIVQFIEDGTVMCAEPPLGGLYILNEEQERIVADFEKEHNALVYLAVKSRTSIGHMDSFLYVSDYKDEWEYDRADIEDGVVMTYTYNYDAPDCSEIGSIGFRSFGGGILRTA